MIVTLFALAAALPVQAITVATPNGWEQRQGTRSGVVEQQLGTQLKIDGKTYQFSLATARVFDRHGKQLDSVRLAPGTQVVFALATDGGAQRVAYLWVLS
jgi:hypothetical protein